MNREKLGSLGPRNVKKTKNKFTVVKDDKLTNIKTFDKDVKEIREKKNTEDHRNRIKRLKQRKAKSKDLTPGIVYLGHIPEGFTAAAMREYFTQFGDVGRIRIACSRKTNRSKGYAFIEFKCDEVAKVVAETMNNYYMFEKLLKCVFIPKEEVKPNMFNGHRSHQKLAFRKAVAEFNKQKTTEQQKKIAQRRINNLEKKRKKLAAMGIDLKFSVDDCKELKKWKLASDQRPNGLTSKDSLSKIESNSDDSAVGDETVSFNKIFSTDNTDTSKYTFELDSSDDDISFTTPPNAKKVLKKEKGSSKKKLSKGALNKSDRSFKYSTPKRRKNSFVTKDL